MTTVGAERSGETKARWRADPLLVPAEISLTALTVASAVGLARVFVDLSYLAPVLLTAVAAHGLSAVLRRWRVPIGPAAVLLLGTGLLVTLWATVGGTTVAGIPTGTTIDAARAALEEGWTTFGSESAPVAASTGLVMMAVVGTWVLACLADWAAFRVDARFEAAVPSLTMFVFGATLGDETFRVGATVIWLGALVAFLAAHGTRTSAERVPWLGRAEVPGMLALGRRAAAVGGLAVLAAAVVGPNLPGADAEAVVPWRGDDTDSVPRVTISPLVDIRSRLVNQANVEVFAVEADVRSYWRLTALDTFDGRIWSSVASYGDAGGELDADPPPAVATVTSRQRFAIGPLATIWVPAAYQPTRVVEGENLRYDTESDSLVTEAASAEGLRYELESILARPDPATLAGAPFGEPPEGPYLDLPADFPASVRDLAARVVEGAGSPYEQALAIQELFRGGEFAYSLDVLPGHGNRDLEVFLFETRVGYCEQFAGAYAALARAVGLPSRVAVGFTPGELGDDGLHHVRGEHAHAWPEVWIPGGGWLAFEPTPGRGAPGHEAYTGLPEQQATAGAPSTATTAVPDATTPTTGAADPGSAPPVTEPTPVTEPRAGPADDEGSRAWLVLAGALAVALVVGLAAAGGAGANVWKRSVRRRSAVATADRIEVAWQEVVDDLTRAGVGPRPGDTPVRLAERAPLELGPARQELATLAELTTEAAYGADDPAPDVAGRAAAASGAVTTAVRRGQPAARRIRWLVDPRAPRR